MQGRENAISVTGREAYSLEVRWPAIPSPFPSVRGAASILQVSVGSQNLPGYHQPQGRRVAAPRPSPGKKVSKRRCSALIGRGGRGPVVRQPMSGAGPELKGGAGGPRSEPQRPQSPPLGPPPPVFVARAGVSAELQPPAG